jgi:hypothetical protein
MWWIERMDGWKKWKVNEVLWMKKHTNKLINLDDLTIVCDIYLRVTGLKASVIAAAGYTTCYFAYTYKTPVICQTSKAGALS